MRQSGKLSAAVALSTLCAALLIAAGIGGRAAEDDKDGRRAEKRQKIDHVAQETLDKVFAETKNGKQLFDKAAGYAVFDNLKISLGVTGGGGSGVAVNKGGGRTYMKMGTGGLNLGLGGQKYQVVFLFETIEIFNNFVETGWQAEASADAVAGTHGAGAQASFRNGMAIFQFTDKGLMLQVDISGTKYWKSKKLN